MAERTGLYKPTIITYVLRDGSYRTPDGKRVKRNTPGAVKVKTKSKKWYGRYTDRAHRPHRVPLSKDKEIARRMLAKLTGDAQLESVGIDNRFGEQRARPLLDHQLLGPIMIHLLTRPALPNVPGWSLPDIDAVCDVFADTFVRAVATPVADD